MTRERGRYPILVTFLGLLLAAAGQVVAAAGPRPGPAAPAQGATATATLPAAVDFGGYSAAVSSHDPWRSSGVRLDGSGLGFADVVGGCWTYWRGVVAYNRGEGDPNAVCADRMPPSSCTEPLPDVPKGALIGRTGGRGFEIGHSARLGLLDGDLALRMNDSDDALADNDGTLYVRAGARAAVAADQGWQATGLAVAAGTELVLQVVGGAWTHQPGAVPPNAGEGGSYVCAQAMPPGACAEPLPDLARGALVGRIGGTLFPVRRGTVLPVPDAGHVMLRINEGDAALADNVGSLEVLVWPRVADHVPANPACGEAVTPTPTPTATNRPPSATPSPPPTATATATATPTATGTPSATPPPLPTTPAYCVCRMAVPRVVVDDALANPAKVYGWGLPLDPGKPPSPANPPRACLGLHNPHLPYHPLWNRPEWRVGCR